MATITKLPGLVQQFDVPTTQDLLDAVMDSNTGLTRDEAATIIRTHPTLIQLSQNFTDLKARYQTLHDRLTAAKTAYENSRT